MPAVVWGAAREGTGPPAHWLDPGDPTTAAAVKTAAAEAAGPKGAARVAMGGSAMGWEEGGGAVDAEAVGGRGLGTVRGACIGVGAAEATGVVARAEAAEGWGAWGWGRPTSSEAPAWGQLREGLVGGVDGQMEVRQFPSEAKHRSKQEQHNCCCQGVEKAW